jgi:chaperonin cofactor prefoldin
MLCTFGDAGLIGELEAIKLQKTGQVEELTSKLETMEMQLARLNAERSSLKSQQQAMSSEQQQTLTSLQRVSLYQTVYLLLL